jgi:hypothetical protein
MNIPSCTLTLPLRGEEWHGMPDGRLLQYPWVGMTPQRCLHLNGHTVDWLLCTPDETRLIVAYSDGTVLTLDTQSGCEISECSCEMQSSYARASATTRGGLSTDGRWLIVSHERDELIVTLRVDLHMLERPCRTVSARSVQGAT